MLNRIRNLSSNPAILLMFGMLILVFVFFFGMPSMGGLTQSEGILNQNGATVFDTEVKLKEAYTHVSQYYNARGQQELDLTGKRLRELERETLIDLIAQRIGWQVSEREVKEYMTSGSNYQHIHFGDDVDRDRLAKAFKAYLKKQNKKVEDLNADELISTFTTFSSKARGFSHKVMKDFLERFTVDAGDYFNTKARELRVRSYLSFLRSHVKAGQAALADEVEWQGRTWTFELTTLGPDQIMGLSPATAAQTQEYVKGHADEIKARYELKEKSNLTRLEFMQVSARYNKDNESEVKAKLTEARARLEKGEDPKEVAKALSTDKISVLAFPRKGTSQQLGEELFKVALALEPKGISAVSQRASSIAGSGNYFTVRLDKKELKKTTTLKESQDEIAAELWLEAQRSARVTADATELHAQVKSGVAIAAAVDAYNAQFEGQESFKPLAISESDEVTLTALASDRIPSISSASGVADQLLAEIMQIDDNRRVPTLIKSGDQLIILSLKESGKVGMLERGTEIEKRELGARFAAQGEFFGNAWTMMALSGHQSLGLTGLYLPRDLQIPIMTEVYVAPQESFLDKLLDSESYKQHIKENPLVTKFLSGVDERG